MPDAASQPFTVLEYFYQWESQKPNEVYLRQPFGNTWKELTWGQVGDQARRIAASLHAMGFQRGDHIGIYSKNCQHWIINDIALMMGGYVSVPFYPNLNAAQLGEVLRLSDAKALFVGKLDDWEHAKDGVPPQVQIIKYPHYPGNATVDRGLEWDKLIANNEPLTGQPDMAPDDLSSILFTSGTTGTPKGVMLPYKAPALLMRNEQEHNSLGIFDGKPHRFISYLPLNHIAERVIVEMASILTGGTVSFVESLEAFPKNLASIQPTIFLSVPRLWAKFRSVIHSKMPPKRLNFLLKTPIMKNVVKKKIKKGLGLHQARVILTGAAPTPDELKDWYARFGLILQEVYGMTENCAGCTLMPRNGVKPGTVGKPLPNVELRTDPDTGEIIMRVPWMMSGYYNSPELTAETLRDGWLHTGDQGEIDEQEYLRVTGRVKDTFKSAKGKFIVPAPLEWKFSKSPHLEQIAVVGLGMPQPLALATLSETGAAAQKEQVATDLDELLAEVNAGLLPYQRIASVVIVKEEWSVDNKILTPTMKIRRAELNKRYQDRYAGWCEAGGVIWE